MKYTVKMQNPKSGKIECYTTKQDDEHIFKISLDVFKEGGYKIIEVISNPINKEC